MENAQGRRDVDDDPAVLKSKVTTVQEITAPRMLRNRQRAKNLNRCLKSWNNDQHGKMKERRDRGRGKAIWFPLGCQENCHFPIGLWRNKNVMEFFDRE